MPHELRVDDLEDLWRAGAVLLPTVAVQYSEVATRLHQTALAETGAFSRPGGGLGPLHAAWTRLRNTMQDSIAVRTHDRLLAAGYALKTIAESYATTEHLSREQLSDFHREIEEIENSPEEYKRPPEYVPDAPSTDDPHPEGAPPSGPSF